uniref:Uncharacterized protein n=1 Tax=Heliothis virescens TaxID=7102 RepID=A0A2A4J6Q4_HELVI
MFDSSTGVQAERNDPTASPNGHHGILLGALTVQNNNRYDTGPNDRNFYGSVVQMKNTFDSSDPSKTRTLTAIAPGGPGHEGITFAWTGDELENLHQTVGKGLTMGAVTIQSGNTYNGEPGNENHYGSIVKQSGNVFYGKRPNGVPMHFGAVTIQRNNHYSTSPGSKNYFGSRVIQEGNVFNFSQAED